MLWSAREAAGLGAATPFIAVVGPSGVGKDSLLSYGRQNLAGDARFVFPKRRITRPQERDEEKRRQGEDYIHVSEATFRQFCDEGRFCLWWTAHGNSYGIPIESQSDSAAGRIVAANLSRTVLPQALALFPGLIVAEVWARPQTIAERSFARGRETADNIVDRLAREAPIEVACPIIRIDNDGAPELAGEAFVDLLMRCANQAR